MYYNRFMYYINAFQKASAAPGRPTCTAKSSCRTFHAAEGKASWKPVPPILLWGFLIWGGIFYYIHTYSLFGGYIYIYSTIITKRNHNYYPVPPKARYRIPRTMTAFSKGQACSPWNSYSFFSFL